MRFNLLVAAFIGARTRYHVDHVGCSSVVTKHVLCLSPLSSASGEIPVSVETSVYESVIERAAEGQGKSSSHTEAAPVARGIRDWLVPSALAAEVSPPTQDEIKLLREAFATFYGMDRDLEKSEQLLSKVIEAWERQAPDEKAASGPFLKLHVCPCSQVLLNLFVWHVLCSPASGTF
jgi:hypothetical protein